MIYGQVFEVIAIIRSADGYAFYIAFAYDGHPF